MFARMGEMQERGEQIDRVTLSNELMRHNQLESCGGLSYLISLDEGLPLFPNIESYARIIKEKSLLWRIVLTSNATIQSALRGHDPASEILASAQESLLGLDAQTRDGGMMTPLQIIEACPGGLNAFLDPGNRVRGIETGYRKLDEMTGGLHPES